jgi:hypothetical protein
VKGFIAFFIMVTCGLLMVERVVGKEAPEDTLKAIYLVHISKLTTWPDKLESSSTFSICINKNTPLSKNLKKIEQQVTINGKPLKIQHDLSPEQLVKCNVFYISSADISIFKQYQSKLEMNAVLTVSSEENFTENGEGVIGYYIDKITKKVKMRVNLTTLRKMNIKISSKLLRLMKQRS